MNHLHWPRALRHSSDAVEDFRKCLNLQRGSDGASGRAYHEWTHVLLGDSLAKAGDYDEARAAWREGFRLFPDSDDLARRVRLEGDDEALEFVEDRRSLEQPIDTDFSFPTR